MGATKGSSSTTLSSPAYVYCNKIHVLSFHSPVVHTCQYLWGLGNSECALFSVVLLLLKKGRGSDDQLLF